MSVTSFVGLDVGSEAHVLAAVDAVDAVDARGDVTQRPLRCTEDAEGYAPRRRARGARRRARGARRARGDARRV
jgi:hypothetical protein